VINVLKEVAVNLDYGENSLFAPTSSPCRPDLKPVAWATQATPDRQRRDVPPLTADRPSGTVIA
jgi:hypothetical protein